VAFGEMLRPSAVSTAIQTRFHMWGLYNNLRRRRVLTFAAQSTRYRGLVP
jgi:hypothetical protein